VRRRFTMDAVHNAILAANKEFMAAFERGDAPAIADMYTDDGKLLPPNSPMLAGKQAIRAFWQGAKEAGGKATKLETLDVESHDDLAIEIGRYTLTLQSKSGGSVTDQGKYIVVWKNDHGVWKLQIDIWNTDAPA
jgi:uncharacterized protein (TIGR02246 family)